MSNLTDAKGEKLIREWYHLIDAKAPFASLAELVDQAELVVDFPGNQMDYEGFCKWYAKQSHDYTGCHNIHCIQVQHDEGQLKIFAEITWQAISCDGKPITLYPNVTICLSEKTGLVTYYGCVDRVPTSSI